MFDVGTGISSLSAGFLPFIVYFVVGLGLLSAFCWCYAKATPHKEVELIKANNTAAAISFTGAVLGFAIPLANLIVQTVTIFEFIFWGLAAGLVQLGTFFLFRIAFPKISERIEAGEVSAPTVLAGLHVVVGLINAASLTY